MRRWDVILIGSGISSLTAAAILSQKGKSVRVLEKYVKPGGYLHCFNRFGCTFDTGAHYTGALGPGDPFRVLLEYVGAFDESLFVPLDPDGFDELRFPSFSFAMRKGHDATAAALCEMFPDDARGIRAYFDRIRATVAAFPTYEFRDEIDGPFVIDALETSLERVVEGLVRDPKLKCILYAYCGLHGVQPRDISFGFHALVTDSLLRGAYGFRRGGDALAAALTKVIEKNGGEVVTRCAVERLETRDGLVSRVVANGEALEAEWIVSGIHPKATFRLFAPDEATRLFKPAFRERLAALQESPGVFGVYASCRAPSGLRRDRNYYFFDGESPHEITTPRPALEPPSMVFAARPDRVEGAQAKGEPLLLHAPSPVEWFAPWRASRYGKRCAEYENFKACHAEAIIQFVDGYRPGVKGGVDRFLTSTPLTNMHFNGAEDGSAYGIYHSIQNSGVRALGPRTHVRNLLLTGQSCLFPGLIGAAISGMRSAGHIVGIKPILRELRERMSASGVTGT